MPDGANMNQFVRIEGAGTEHDQRAVVGVQVSPIGLLVLVEVELPVGQQHVDPFGLGTGIDVEDRVRQHNAVAVLLPNIRRRDEGNVEFEGAAGVEQRIR